MAADLSRAALARARAARRRLKDGSRIADDAGAARFIDERGFALLMPLAGVPLPSVSEADGAAPWSEEFRCTDRAWAWKETLPGRKLCAYGKLIRHRGTFISWRLFPAFAAVYGPAGDLAEEYEAGRLGRAERDLAEMVAEYGPVSSHDLWRRARGLFGGRRHQFLAALDRLQAGFILTVAGGTLDGWSQHAWDLVERQAPPDVLARVPPTSAAREAILEQTMENCVALPEAALRSILRWSPQELTAAVTALSSRGLLRKILVEDERAPWLALNSPL